MHAWFVPTLDRLVSIMNYPDKANEFASSKVTSEAARQALQLLLNHMSAEMPSPRIEPTADGGLRCEWNEYWVDCVLIVTAPGTPQVELNINRDAPIDGYRAPIDESAIGHEQAARLLERSFRLIDELLRPAPRASSDPITQAVPPPLSHPKG